MTLPRGMQRHPHMLVKTLRIATRAIAEERGAHRCIQATTATRSAEQESNRGVEGQRPSYSSVTNIEEGKLLPVHPKTLRKLDTGFRWPIPPAM